mgnify:CR=1 FL=1
MAATICSIGKPLRSSRFNCKATGSPISWSAAFASCSMFSAMLPSKRMNDAQSASLSSSGKKLEWTRRERVMSAQPREARWSRRCVTHCVTHCARTARHCAPAARATRAVCAHYGRTAGALHAHCGHQASASHESGNSSFGSERMAHSTAEG